MRFLELFLKAWGPFAHERLDLSGGKQGLHVIFGPNEAGKSSTLRGLHSLFYGIPQKTGDDFVHGYKKLRVGARVRNNVQQELTFFRRKGRKNTLLDVDGRALPPKALEPFMGRSVEEALFYNMFAMDHHLLRQGGRELLEGSGDLGEALFAAGSGVGHLKSLMNGLEKETEALFKGRATSVEIPQAIKALKEHGAAVRELSQKGSQWKKLKKQLRELEEKHEELGGEGRLKSTEHLRLERLAGAIPLLAQRREIKEKLLDFEGAPLLGEGFGEERRSLQKQIRDAESQLEKGSEKLQKIEEELPSLEVPHGLLERRDTIQGLYEDRKVHQKAAGDEKKLQGQLRAQRQVIEGLKGALGFEKEGSMAPKLPSIQEVSRVRRLGRKLTSVEEKVEARKKSVEELDEEISGIQGSLDALPDSQNPLPLKTAMDRAKGEGPIEEELTDLDALLAQKRRELTVAVKVLPMWEGSLEDLSVLSAPSRQTIHSFQEAFSKVERQETRLEERGEELRDQREKLDAAMAPLVQGESSHGREDLNAARSRRRERWEVLSGWLAGDKLPSIQERLQALLGFEQAQRESDEISDWLVDHSEQVAQLEANQRDKAQVATKLEALEEQKRKVEAQKRDLEKDWKAQWEGCGLEPLLPKEMAEWRLEQKELARQVGELQSLEEKAKRLEELTSKHREAVLGELKVFDGVGEENEGTLAEVLTLAHGTYEKNKEIVNKRERLLERLGEKRVFVRKQRQELEKQEGLLTESQGQWVEAISLLGLSRDTAPKEAGEVLDKFGELREAAEKEKELMARIEGIQRDADEFKGRVTALLGEVASDLLWGERGVEVIEAIEAMDRLHGRFEETQETRRKRDKLIEERRLIKEKMEEAQGKLEQGQADLQKLLDRAGCQKEEELPSVEEKAKKAQKLRDSLLQLEERLGDYRGNASLEELAQEADKWDPDEIPGQIKKLTEEKDGLEEKQKEIAKEMGGLQEKLKSFGGGDAASRTEALRQESEARVRALVDDYAVKKMASVLLSQEIERFREQNQGPIVSSAGEFFSKLTCGGFDGIVTDFDGEDRPRLVAQKKGERLGVEALSDGTRDGLFLALRLAFIKKRALEEEPIPLILDDVLINFDDGRARAALEVFADFSSHTQVLFFTHHAHLVDLAQEVVGKERLFISDMP